MKNLIITMAIVAIAAGCAKPEPAEPLLITEAEAAESVKTVEGEWTAIDDCSFWIDNNSYTTHITHIEYNIVEITNALNLETGNGDDGTMHGSVVNNELIIPAQSYLDNRYEVSGIGSLSEDGSSMNISLEVTDSNGDVVDGCDITLEQ